MTKNGQIFLNFDQAPRHRSPVNSPHKGQWALMFSLICARINGWENNGETGDLRRHCVLYGVTVMVSAQVNRNKLDCAHLNQMQHQPSMSFISTQHLLFCLEVSTQHPIPFHPASWRNIRLWNLTSGGMSRIHSSLIPVDLWPLLLTWFNFNPSMDK